MKEKIKELLGVGLPANVVASACGVDDSYVSQLLSQDEFAAEVQQLKLANLTEAAGRDGAWNTLEDDLLAKIKDLLPLMTKPMEVIRALQVANSATRRAAPREMAATAVHQHVHLHLPQVVQQKFVVNNHSQVVEVDGRTIATMPANKAVALMNERLAAKQKTAAIAADEQSAAGRLAGLKTVDLLPLAEQI